MKRLAIVALMLFVGCENTRSKLEGSTKGGVAEGEGGGEDTAEIESLLHSIDDRLTSLEQAEKASKSGGTTDAAIAERIAKIEASLTRREEALGFLEMAYQQQKRQQDQQEAQEPDDKAVFAVDISKALAAGQVEGPNSALVTIVEAWDFA